MNAGILTPPTQFATMPRGLLGRPTPVPMIDARRVFDPDAERYIAAVERADGRPLEEAVRVAIGEFVIGCKEDGIWSAIKASCLLMGARTLAGALTPLVGAAPTNNNFVSGDYSRTTGLVGNGTNKFLNANRASNADPQDNNHLAAYVSVMELDTAARGLIGEGVSGTGASHLATGASGSNVAMFSRSRSTNASGHGPSGVGLRGYSRSSSSQYLFRHNGTNTTHSIASQTPSGNSHFVFNRNGGAANTQTNARVAFYSIGESIGLAALDFRVSNLYAAVGAAIR